MRQMVHFSIRVPAGLKADVERVAKAAGHSSTSKVIRDILEQHFHGMALSKDIAVARRVGAVVKVRR